MTRETLITGIEAAASIVLVNFVDNTLLAFALFLGLENLVVIKEVGNVVVTILIAVYWIGKIIQDKKQSKNNSKNG